MRALAGVALTILLFPPPGNADVTGGKVLEEAPRVGYLAPRFKLPGPDGLPLKLTNYRGRVVLLNFWASWCVPCVKEMPDLAELQAAFPRNLAVLGVNADGKLEAVFEFLREHPVNFAIALDEDRDVMRAYSVRGLPATFLIDSRGVVLERIMGPREWSSPAWKNRIAGLVAELAPSPKDAHHPALPVRDGTPHD